jgi:hypothetical protein
VSYSLALHLRWWPLLSIEISLIVLLLRLLAGVNPFLILIVLWSCRHLQEIKNNKISWKYVFSFVPVIHAMGSLNPVKMFEPVQSQDLDLQLKWEMTVGQDWWNVFKPITETLFIYWFLSYFSECNKQTEKIKYICFLYMILWRKTIEDWPQLNE